MNFDKKEAHERAMKVGRKLKLRWQRLSLDEKIDHINKCTNAWTPEKRRIQAKATKEKRWS
jgi:hypothetical protein